MYFASPQQDYDSIINSGIGDLDESLTEKVINTNLDNFYSDTTTLNLSTDSFQLVRYYDSSGILSSYKLKLIRPEDRLFELYTGFVTDSTIEWDSNYAIVGFHDSELEHISSVKFVKNKYFTLSSNYLNDLVDSADYNENAN